METIICKECGKELSKKAIICPNCGVKIKQKRIGIIGIIIVILLFMICFGIITYNNRVKESYVGTWILQSKEPIIEYQERTIIIDKELKIIKKNVFEGMGDTSCIRNNSDIIEERCEEAEPIVFLNSKDKIVGINFITQTESGILICFEKTGNELKQISCEKSRGSYSINGGINEKLNITYKKD